MSEKQQVAIIRTDKGSGTGWVGFAPCRDLRKIIAELSRKPSYSLFKLCPQSFPQSFHDGAALPKAWRNPQSYEDRVALVRYAFDRGVRYFDMAGKWTVGTMATAAGGSPGDVRALASDGLPARAVVAGAAGE